MKQLTTYVGVDAHKKDLFIATLVGDRAMPVTWQVPNEPQALRPLVRKLEREDGAREDLQRCRHRKQQSRASRTSSTRGREAAERTSGIG
jgi:hypothetical protein